jgi:hypothetical protein
MPATIKQAEGHPWGYTQRFFEKVIHNFRCGSRGEPRIDTNWREFGDTGIERPRKVTRRHKKPLREIPPRLANNWGYYRTREGKIIEGKIMNERSEKKR